MTEYKNYHRQSSSSKSHATSLLLYNPRHKHTYPQDCLIKKRKQNRQPHRSPYNHLSSRTGAPYATRCKVDTHTHTQPAPRGHSSAGNWQSGLPPSTPESNLSPRAPASARECPGAVPIDRALRDDYIDGDDARCADFLNRARAPALRRINVLSRNQQPGQLITHCAHAEADVDYTSYLRLLSVSLL